MEKTPLAPLGAYGDRRQKPSGYGRGVCLTLAERGMEVVILRPKTFIESGRLGIFEILFQWIREGRRIYLIGSGQNRYELLAIEDLADAILLAAARPVLALS